MINQLIDKLEDVQRIPRQLRELLGQIMTYINNASEIYKNVRRNPNEKNIEQAKELLAEIQSGVFKKLHEKLEPIKNLYSHDKTLSHLIQTLINSDISPRQAEQIRAAVQAGATAATGFRSEVDQRGLDEHLKSSIYNTPNAADRTLKAIREILQNAVDATDPKQHPELTQRQGYLPQIELTTSMHEDSKGTKYLDLVVEDHGVGMDWKTLSEKFLVLFQSGKQTDTGAAGGFGIAKALIQNTPEHGWSIDTNDIHSSRFHKNIYFGSQAQEYEHPKSKIKKTQDGATLSLYGLPYVYSYQIRDLCEVYGTNGRVAIVLDGEKIKPRFTVDSQEVTAFDSENLESLAKSAAGDNNPEAANKILSKYKNNIAEKINDVADQETETTKVKFLTRKNTSYGKLYVMVNGQYQFEESIFLDKLDVICYIETKARPSDSAYPLDPGRAYVRDPLGSKIRAAVNAIREFTSQVSKDDLLKNGVDALMINSEHDPMMTKMSDAEQAEDKLVDAIASDLSQTMNQSPQDREDSLKKLLDTVRRGTPSAETKEIIDQLAKEIIEKNASKIDVRELRKVIEGLTTPATVMVQKNFVASEWAKQNVEMTSSMLILWQRVLRIVLDKLSSTRRFRDAIKLKKFIPGIIYSDECLGLYMPASPDFGRPFESVSINPMTLAAAIEPDLFAKKVSMMDKPAFESSDKEEEENNKSRVADTPTNRVTKLLYYIATHELCHLLYTDYGNSNDEFHKNITHIELATHDCFEAVRDEVKEFMKSIKKTSKSLIMAVAKQKRQTQSENYINLDSFETFLRRKYVLPKIEQMPEIKVERKNMNFREWFKLNY